MMKIAEMYRLSGGADYRHMCVECHNCKRVKGGYVCQLYVKHGGSGTWKPQYIACKFFDLPEAPATEPEATEEENFVQMSIFDYIKEPRRKKKQ